MRGCHSTTTTWGARAGLSADPNFTSPQISHLPEPPRGRASCRGCSGRSAAAPLGLCFPCLLSPGVAAAGIQLLIFFLSFSVSSGRPLALVPRGEMEVSWGDAGRCQQLQRPWAAPQGSAFCTYLLCLAFIFQLGLFFLYNFRFFFLTWA